MATITDPSGAVRQTGDLGFLSPPNSPFTVFGVSEATPPALPQTEWKARTLAKKLSFWPKTIKNQADTNECNAFAICYAMEAIRRINGAREIALSPGFIYGHINQGFDNGSRLEDGLNLVQRIGTVPATVVAELEWHPMRFPPTADSIAQSFRALEWWLCPRFELMASAVHHGYPVVFGIAWGRDERIDDQGWLADGPPGGIAGGHAMCALGLAKRGDQWGLITVNSWGTRWGRDGWHVVPETRFVQNMFGGGAWALRSVTLDDVEGPNSG